MTPVPGGIMRFILLFLFFCAHQVMAGSALTVLSLKHHGPSPRGVNQLAGDINMPFVQAADKVLAAKINDQLFLAQFGMLAPPSGASQFTAPDDTSLSGIASLDFSVSRNDERILTIVLGIEGCGAYCESYQTVFSFDVKTGRQILIKDMISATGMQELLRRAKAGQVAAWRRLLASLRDDLKAARKKHMTGYALEDLKNRIEFNSRCLGDGGHTDRTPGQVESVISFDYLKTELAADGFKVTLERCSNHAQRALDDVADFTLTVSYAELKPLLTRYGKAVLSGEGKSGKRSQ